MYFSLRCRVWFNNLAVDAIYVGCVSLRYTLLWQGSIALARWETLTEARKARRQRKLDQVEIPANEVVIFEEELLGKGGFGEVFVAEYNKQIAAAKVCLRLGLVHEYHPMKVYAVFGGPSGPHHHLSQD